MVYRKAVLAPVISLSSGHAAILAHDARSRDIPTQSRDRNVLLFIPLDEVALDQLLQLFP